MSEEKSELEMFKEIMRGFVEYYDRFNTFYYNIIMDIPFDDTLSFSIIKVANKQVMSNIQEAVKVLECLQKRLSILSNDNKSSFEHIIEGKK